MGKMSSKLIRLLDDCNYFEQIYGKKEGTLESFEDGDPDRVSTTKIEKSPDVEYSLLKVYDNLQEYFKNNSVEIGTNCGYFEFREWMDGFIKNDPAKLTVER